MRRVVLSAFFLLLCVPAVWPQTTTGTVSGTVRDQSGAVVPNAEMVLTNSETNVAARTRTTGAGVYFYPTVIPGSSRLALGFTGMQKYEATFTIQVSQSVVVDPVLHAAGTATTLEVKDVTPLVTMDNATVRSNL